MIKTYLRALLVPAALLSLASTVNLLAQTQSSASTQAVSKQATIPTKSPKRGIAYDLAAAADLTALAPGVSWWYNWGSAPNSQVPASYLTQYKMDYYPMLWNGNFNTSQIKSFLKANPQIKYLLVLNEPNVQGQAYLTPQQAATLWPQYEAVAAAANVAIVGPQITWGNMPNYNDPITWLDAFYTAYENANGGRQPRIDYLGSTGMTTASIVNLPA